jgi:hypothetical protein
VAEYEVLLEQARLQVGQQEASFDTLRTRVTAILSIGGVVAALFAPHYLHKGNAWSYWAIGFFAGTVIVGAILLWPRDWAVGVPLGDYQQWITDHRSWRAEHDPDGDDLSAALTEEIAATLVLAYVGNRSKYEWLARGYGLQCLLLGIEIILWILAVLIS